MRNDTLNIAAKLGAIETVTLVNGYDKHKTQQITFRRFTMDDIRALDNTFNNTTFWFESIQGQARQCRKASQLKTWKRDPNRFECTMKYGMYESFRMTTQDMLNQLLVRL